MPTDALVTDVEGGEAEKGYYNTKLLCPIVHQFKEFRSWKKNYISYFECLGSGFSMFRKTRKYENRHNRKNFKMIYCVQFLCFKCFLRYWKWNFLITFTSMSLLYSHTLPCSPSLNRLTALEADSLTSTQQCKNPFPSINRNRNNTQVSNNYIT